MPIQYINTGTAPNQGNGDSLRLAFTKINNNFSLLADNSFTYNAVGEVIDHPELQRGISVTYNPLNQAASFLVNIAGPDTLGAVRIGGGITLNPDTGLISVFDGNYNNLTNIPQALGTTASPTFADLHVTGSLDIAGETTIINSSGIETANLNITLAKDATSESEANTAGIIVNGPESPASLRYTASDDSWNFNKRVNIPTLYVNGQFFSPGGLGDITVDLNVISTVNQDQDIILNPDGNGRIRLVNTPMQFDNGNNGVYSDHLIYTAPNAGKVGFGIGVSNNSPRIVGDGVTPGIVADFGIYAAGTGTWTSAVTVNSDGSLKAAGTIYQGIAYDGIDFPNTAIRVDANVDSYAELVMKNHNTGTNASTDLVIMNDQGTDTENFIDLGINSSNYSVTQYSSTQPNDGYLFVNGGNLVIGTQTPNKKIVFHAGGTRDIDSTAFFDEYAWQFNRPVTIDVDKPVPLNFTVINRSSNVVAQSLFQAVNNLGNLVHFGINSSHPEAFYGRIGPNEAFLHVENSTSTLHIGGYGDTVFYSDQTNGFAGTPTLVMSSIDQSSTFAGHLLPTTDLTYDLGSTSSQWRSLYVGTSTVYFGGIPLRVTQEGGITVNDIAVSGGIPSQLENGEAILSLDNEGSLVFGNGGRIRETVVTDNPTIVIEPALADSPNQALYIKGGIGPVDYHLHLTTGDLTDTSVIVGTDDHNIRTTIDGGVEINTFLYPDGGGSAKWIFDNYGDLTFPGSSNARIGESEPGLVVYSGNGFAVVTNANSVNTYEVEVTGYISNGFGDDTGATLTVTDIIAGTITDGMTVYGDGLPPEGWEVTFGGGVMEPQGTGGTGNYLLNGANILTAPQSFNNGVLAAGSQPWVFGTDGITTFPDGTTSTGNVVFANSSSYQIKTISFNGSPSNVVSTFEFSIEGMTIPGNGFIRNEGQEGYWALDGVNSRLQFPNLARIGYGTNEGLSAEEDLRIYADNTGSIFLLAGSEEWSFGNDGSITFPDATVQTTAYVATDNVTKVTGTWTVTTGTNDYSFTVPVNGVYHLWARANIANGIVSYTATAAVTNSNVPVLGTQYAWNYTGAGNPILFTTLPTQFIGTEGAISTSNPSVGTATNTFVFGLQNNTAENVTVEYGYTKIS